MKEPMLLFTRVHYSNGEWKEDEENAVPERLIMAIADHEPGISVIRTNDGKIYFPKGTVREQLCES